MSTTHTVNAGETAFRVYPAVPVELVPAAEAVLVKALRAEATWEFFGGTFTLRGVEYQAIPRGKAVRR